MRPFQYLPIKLPKDHNPGPLFFYENIVEKLIPDMIRMMTTGMCIDQKQVNNLRVVIDDVLKSVDDRLANNPVIKEFQKLQQKSAQKKHYEKATQAIRTYEHYLKDYDNSMQARTWVVNTYLKSKGLSKDTKKSWPVAELKRYNVFKADSFLENIINKSVDAKHPKAIDGMMALAGYKAELWNRPRFEKANEEAEIPPFNPGSAQQKQRLFELLEIEPISFSDKTGDASWDRDAIEELKKQTPDDKEELHEILDCFIDHSFSGIIRSNFLAGFDKFTIEDVLYGNIKLFGAKSFRPTSNSPNLLNMPSTKSIYAKPLKKCFVAPEGFLIYAIDLSALEDRVLANLSGDQNKINIFLEGLDGHSLNACGYYAEEVEAILGTFPTTVQIVKAFMAAVDTDARIKALRQASKGPTFKLAYGGYPDDHKGGVITPEIFENYHNVLYSGISKYREEYVLATSRQQGYLHLGLGCEIHTDNAENDIRTLHNATIQFWSILTLIAINELNYLIDKAGLQNDIQVCATIYDSIYFYVREDAEVIEWLNTEAVRVLCSDYLENQVVSNEAEGEIGPNWADLVAVPNYATKDQIADILTKLKDKP